MMIRTIVAAVAFATGVAAEAPHLWYTQPATSWSEALPIGNGRLAAMVFGGIDSEHLQLNEETIYAGKEMDRTNPQARANLPEVRRLLLAGKVIEAQELAAKTLMAIPLRQPPYEPLGDLTVTFSNAEAGNTTGYRRTLDLYDGVVSVQYTAGGIRYSRTAFASYPDGAIVLHIEADKPRALRFTIRLTRQRDAETAVIGSDALLMKGLALPPPSYPEEAHTGTHFASAVRVLTDGTVAGSGNELKVENATRATLVLTASTDVRTANPETDCQAALQAAGQRSYAELLARHRADFRAISTRVALDINNNQRVADTVPTDVLLKQGNDDAITPLYFAFGRYLLQSSSRANSLAANLQGKWNDSFDPPWGSKYTININTEMNYWPAETANVPESVEGLYNLLARMQPNGRRTAREMYGTEGFVAHHNTEVWADTQPIDGVPWGLWPDGAAWLSLALWDHYQFSGDKQYLRDKAYPMLRDTADFLLRNLFPDGQGHLVSGPSLSPENQYYTADHQKASLDLSPTMDVEIDNALFARVIEASKILNTDAAFRQSLQSAMAKLVPLQIGKHGQLQEWRKDYEEVEPGHRHLSLLFAVYPSDEINPSRPDLWNASRVSLERRLAAGGGGTGWSRAWVICLWARFREAEKARDSLHVLFSQSTWPNLFDLHPPGVFQIDGNLGATAAVAEMLLQSQTGKIDLLPALPAEWHEGSVTGLRARGGVTVDIAWRGGRVSTATFRASHDQSLSVSANGASKRIKLAAGKELAVRWDVRD